MRSKGSSGTAAVVASRVSELINEITIVMSADIGMGPLAKVALTYTARPEAIVLAAQAHKRGPDKATDEAAHRAMLAGSR